MIQKAWWEYGCKMTERQFVKEEENDRIRFKDSRIEECFQ